MDLRENDEGGILTIRPAVTQIDTTNAQELRDGLIAKIDEGHRTILLDLGRVEFMDSSALGAMISGMKQLESKGEILLCNVSEPILGLLKLTQMVRIFPVFATEEEARASRMGRVG